MFAMRKNDDFIMGQRIRAVTEFDIFVGFVSGALS